MREQRHQIEVLLPLFRLLIGSDLIEALDESLDNLRAKIHSNDLVDRRDEARVQDDKGILQRDAIHDEVQKKRRECRCDVLARVLAIELLDLTQNRDEVRFRELVQCALCLSAQTDLFLGVGVWGAERWGDVFGSV